MRRARRRGRWPPLRHQPRIFPATSGVSSLGVVKRGRTASNRCNRLTSSISELLSGKFEFLAVHTCAAKTEIARPGPDLY
jgi:hypothetical protein